MYEVLLIDDEPLAIEGLQLLIDWEKYGFRIGGTYENGEEAVRRICSDPPDLVVTDIRMPGMDGLRLIEEARSGGNRSTLFVIASGYGDFDYALRAMHLGVSHYLTKPLIEEEAEEMLDRLSRELQERALKACMARRAEALEEQQALEAALFGQGEQSQNQKAVLERLSQNFLSWCWVQITAESRILPAVREAVRLIESEAYAAFFSKWIESSGCGVVIGSAESSNAAAEIRRLIEQLLGHLPTESQEHVRLAVGRIVMKPEQLHASLESAEKTARCSFYDGSRLGFYEQTIGMQLSFEAPPPGLAERIAGSTENASEDEVRERLDSVFANFKQQRLDPKLVLVFAEQVVLACASVLKELGGDPESLIRSSPFCGNAPLLPTIDQSQRHLERFCLSCRKEVMLIRECKGGGVQGQVAHFLRGNYTDTFTIQELAERFYVHPAYLGQSFTRKYGVGISEFVHRLRIDEACRLLKSSELTSYAIAERLGYKDYRHFLKQFEKRTGVKPTAYRTPD
ncbi:response regulator transcription factor [Saccharibacillus sacchari]|uniref:response regulator transcription factor n=1 Tax=Saccharibacillus sacchari TaxID=456493 RepID=UPI0004B88F67|nr:response regulator [Saccharibacillus sacchari]